MSFSNYLNEKHLVSDEGRVDYIVESVSLDVLEEAIESFDELPNRWKKLLAMYHTAGENSKIETIRYATKNEASFNKAISDVFKKSTELSYIIVEIQDQPFALMYNNNNEYDPEKFTFTTLDGSKFSRNEYIKGTKKNNYKGYYVPREYFKTNDAKDKLKYEIVAFGRKQLENGDEMTYDDVIKTLNISVVLVKPDEQRIAKRADRRANKVFVGTLSANKKKVIRKFMSDVVENILDDINNSSIKFKDTNDLLDDILEGKNVDFNVLKDNQDLIFNKFRDLSKILTAFKDAYSSGKIMDTNYWDEKGKAGMYTEYLLKVIKDYEKTYNSN